MQDDKQQELFHDEMNNPVISNWNISFQMKHKSEKSKKNQKKNQERNKETKLSYRG